MRYQTELNVADVPQAQSHVVEVDADTPEQAADKANEYWLQHWVGPSPTTETSIHVRAINQAGSVECQELFHLGIHLDTFDDKALERKRLNWALEKDSSKRIAIPSTWKVMTNSFYAKQVGRHTQPIPKDSVLQVVPIGDIPAYWRSDDPPRVRFKFQRSDWWAFERNFLEATERLDQATNRQ